MKDHHDKQTMDAFAAPRRGRPVTGQAKTRAQVQKEYRERQKALGVVTLKITRAEALLMLDLLAPIIRPDDDHGDPALDLLHRLERVTGTVARLRHNF